MILKCSERDLMLRYFIGTSGWNYDDWRESFYPAHWPKRRWLEYYVTQFSTVEINATFYRTFKADVYKKWYEKAPPNFKYVLKIPRLITHIKMLKDVEADIKQFYESAGLLKEKLGVLLLQLHPKMPYDLERLQTFLLALEKPSKVVVEFRDSKWLTIETKALLTEFGCIFCDVNSPKMQFVHWGTSETAYLRLHGSKRWYDYNYTYKELTSIADVARQLVQRGAKRVYVFFNNDFHANAPNNARTLIDLLGQRPKDER
jgi:uncharacterized protein YecE (DUF72 family)